MAILVLRSVDERISIYFATGFMSGARTAGSPAGMAPVRCVGHRSTDSIRLQTAFVFFSFSFVAAGTC